IASESQDVDKEFEERKTMVIEHNKKYDSGESTYYCGMNHMSDLEIHEVCGGGKGELSGRE
uniref:Cathepsin propeptide inhibitor domain-containing protein n=1 Tax=Hucho hucho TaxID=62062 RepID=A0A4W5RY96_9TELE